MVVANPAQVYRSHYTKSEPITAYMVKKLAAASGMQVLEPCAGDGVFADALNKQVSDLSLDLHELNPQALVILREKYAFNSAVKVIAGDTLTSEDLVLYSNAGGIYDRVIGNPPYGGWQDFERRKQLKKLYPGFYVKETYALFLYRCVLLLRDTGVLVFIVPDTFLSLHRHTALREYLLTHTKIREIALFPSSFFSGVNFGYSNLSILTLEKANNPQECLANRFNLVSGFRKADDLINLNGDSLRSQTFVQSEVYANSSHALFVSSDTIIDCINTCVSTVGEVADCVTGFYSGNDKKYLRSSSPQTRNSAKYAFLNEDLLCADFSTRSDLLAGINSPDCFIPIVKGGNTKYFKPDAWYIDWSSEAVTNYVLNKKARFQNASYYFKHGIAVPMVSATQITASLIEHRLFDQSIVGVFPKNPKWLYYMLAFFNSPTCNTLIRTINPSANNSANYLKKIPFIVPPGDLLYEVDIMVKSIIQALKAGKSYNQEHEMKLNDIIKEVYGF